MAELLIHQVVLKSLKEALDLSLRVPPSDPGMEVLAAASESPGLPSAEILAATVVTHMESDVIRAARRLDAQRAAVTAMLKERVPVGSPLQRVFHGAQAGRRIHRTVPIFEQPVVSRKIQTVPVGFLGSAMLMGGPTGLSAALASLEGGEKIEKADVESFGVVLNQFAMYLEKHPVRGISTKDLRWIALELFNVEMGRIKANRVDGNLLPQVAETLRTLPEQYYRRMLSDIAERVPFVMAKDKHTRGRVDRLQKPSRLALWKSRWIGTWADVHRRFEKSARVYRGLGDWMHFVHKREAAQKFYAREGAAWMYEVAEIQHAMLTEEAYLVIGPPGSDPKQLLNFANRPLTIDDSMRRTTDRLRFMEGLLGNLFEQAAYAYWRSGSGVAARVAAEAALRAEWYVRRFETMLERAGAMIHDGLQWIDGIHYTRFADGRKPRGAFSGSPFLLSVSR